MARLIQISNDSEQTKLQSIGVYLNELSRERKDRQLCMITPRDFQSFMVAFCNSSSFTKRECTQASMRSHVSDRHALQPIALKNRS